LTARKARYAAITPYHKEDRHVLERCITSVRQQTIKTDHFLISDGFPQDWIDSAVLRHIKLGVEHGDYGNTPRGIGGLLAAAQGYDGIFFLDADNWLEPSHVQACLTAASSQFETALECDLVIAQRLFRRPDESIMPVQEEVGHVDTNCLFFLPGAYNLLSIWVTMPKLMASLGDRFFYQVVASRGLKISQCGLATVNYSCLWEIFYRQLGEAPPPGAKASIYVDMKAIVNRMSSRELEIAKRLSGGVALLG